MYITVFACLEHKHTPSLKWYMAELSLRVGLIQYMYPRSHPSPVFCSSVCVQYITWKRNNAANRRTKNRAGLGMRLQYMYTLHVHTTCTHYMYTLHVHTYGCISYSCLYKACTHHVPAACNKSLAIWHFKLSDACTQKFMME